MFRIPSYTCREHAPKQESTWIMWACLPPVPPGAKESPLRHGSQCCPCHRHAWRYQKHWARLLKSPRNSVTWTTRVGWEVLQMPTACGCVHPVTEVCVRWTCVKVPYWSCWNMLTSSSLLAAPPAPHPHTTCQHKTNVLVLATYLKYTNKKLEVQTA